jgi:hypothetical protein
MGARTPMPLTLHNTIVEAKQILKNQKEGEQHAKTDKK